MSTLPSRPDKVRVADIVFGARSGGSEAQFSYLLPFEAAPGDLVLAPLSNRPLVGVVCRVYEADSAALGFPLDKLKPLESHIHGVALPRPLLNLAQQVSMSYLCTLPVAVGPTLPPAIEDRLSHRWVLNPARLGAGLALTPLQSEIVETAKAQGGSLAQARNLPLHHRKALRLLEAKGLMWRTTSLALEETRPAGHLLKLIGDEERIDAYLREHAQKRPAQALTLLRLRETEAGALTLEDIKALSGVTQTVVKSLIDAGLLEPIQEDTRSSPSAAPTPNSSQTDAIQAIATSIQKKEPKGFLLYGVTGSGKTEVYLRAAAEALRQGRQVLYLVPEIALATQAIGQLRGRFGNSVAVLHSELTPKERLASWLRIAKGDAPVVIGARSALFAPLDNLGLIVVDEEHEASYKQESSPRYHAKSLVQFLAQEHKCPYVLGSATPSIESYFEARSGKLRLLELPSRAASAQLPSVEIEDLGFGFRTGKPALLTERLEELLQETVQAGRQAILFLNRRAYAPFLVCRECGHFFMCPRCAVTLTYSRKTTRLRCHHCGHQERPPDVCPSCQGSRLNPIGVGTEKVEEAVQELLPQATIERLDRDVAHKKGALESILARFGAGEIDVLVGTQIVAKGLNFPNVTLVGVVAADVSLNLPDFRAAERTFQLLSQVAGRAGRGDAAGRVVIQTFSPSHISVQSAQRHDYLAFYESAIFEREDAGYPPFSRLVNIVFSGTDFAPVVQTSEEAARRLRHVLPEAEVLGPAQCVLERLHNRWRWHILLKLPATVDLQRIPEAIGNLDKGRVQVVVDVDPYSLM